MKWLIIGHYGGSNTGDEAMLAGLLGSLDAKVVEQMVAVTKDGSVPVFAEGTGLSCIPPQASAILKALRASDGLLLGGGTHFHDDYKTARLTRHFVYMSRIVILSWLARLSGKRVAWISMGFGPFSNILTKVLTSIGLKACHVVTIRELESLREASRLTSSKRLRHTFDLAALNPIEPKPASALENHEGKCVLGISLTSVAGSRAGTPEADAQIQQRLATALKRSIAANPNLSIRVIVIRGGSREDDVAMSQELVDAIGKDYQDRVSLVPYHNDPRVMLRLISECDVFLATRFHAGVLGYIGGCRLILLAYHRKLKDLADEILLPSNRCIDLSTEVTVEQFQSAIEVLVSGDPSCRPNLPIDEAVKRSRKNIECLEFD